MSLANTKLFESPESDFVLVSGEGHRFPVQKELLIANSTVFKDILAVPQATDCPEAEVKVAETTALLDVFLRFLHRGPNPTDLTMETVRSLLELTDKYDVPILAPALGLAVLARASEQPMEAWALLVIYGQREAAKLCFAWMDRAPPKAQAAEVNGRYIWSRYTPAFIPVDLFVRVPAQELQALLVLNDNYTFESIGSWVEAAARF